MNFTEQTTETIPQKIRGFKAFNKDFKCRDFQFQENTSYSINGDIKICKNGFHFCKEPFAIFNYYPFDSVFAIVNGENCLTDNDKTVCSRIDIGNKISFKDLIKEEVNFILANAATTGYRANAATTGDRANAATTGENTVSAGIGINNKAKANIGSMIVLVEWEYINSKYKPINCLGKIVDGVEIKANTYYSLVNGKFVESVD